MEFLHGLMGIDVGTSSRKTIAASDWALLPEKSLEDYTALLMWHSALETNSGTSWKQHTTNWHQPNLFHVHLVSLLYLISNSKKWCQQSYLQKITNPETFETQKNALSCVMLPLLTTSETPFKIYNLQTFPSIIKTVWFSLFGTKAIFHWI